MTYATQQHMVDRFGAVELAQLTDRTSGATIDADVLARALSDADAEIDGYLATRYALPLESTPPMLVRLAADIARYRLFDDKTTEAVRTRYQDAVALLKQLSSGAVRLDAGVDPIPADTTTVPVLARSPARVWGSDVLGLY